MRIKKKAGIDGKLDKAWSRLVKERAKWRCEYCKVGVTKKLESHHIYSRANKSTRWKVENGVCLCFSHHVGSSKFSAHQTPVEFTEWLYKEKGERFMRNLRWKAHSVSKLALFEKKIILEELEKELKEIDEAREKIKEKKEII